MLCFLTCFVYIFLDQLSLLLKGTVVAPPDKFGNVTALFSASQLLWHKLFLFLGVVKLDFCKISLVKCILFNSTGSPDCDDYTWNDVC